VGETHGRMRGEHATPKGTLRTAINYWVVLTPPLGEAGWGFLPKKATKSGSLLKNI